MMGEQRRFRCAIYTRKSSEEGLDQDFNSIEAQREAGEAYVRSQAHEGWVVMPERFDDGGFSGGNMSRPGLARLLESIKDGQVDVVVIYKIDRLTRSLTDFARLAETFDKHNVSFVSVTQQFNTTNSMGRLMLNVLLSFAQFEREITGERIRDKIAASKKKGMWMGGPVPVGYHVQDRRLLVQDKEAAIVRRIFNLYLEVGDVPALVERLKAEGVTTPSRHSARGQPAGGRPFTRGHLYKLLSNPLYIGRVQHKGTSHPGQHEAIIDQQVWSEVQKQLAANTQGPRDRRGRAEAKGALLANVLVAADGSRFVATHAAKGTRRYHYYVEEAKVVGSTARRLPAAEIERATVLALHGYLVDRHQLAHDLEVGGSGSVGLLSNAQALAENLGARLTDKGRHLVRQLVHRVIYRDRQLELEIPRAHLKAALGSRDVRNGGGDVNMRSKDDLVVVRVPLAIRRRGAQLKLVSGADSQSASSPDRSLITAMVRARDWAARIVAGASPAEIAEQEQVTDGYVSQLLPLAFVAPTLVEDVIAGRHPPELTANRLIWKTALPLSWQQQCRALR
jgi:site-specific DNA recombinase